MKKKKNLMSDALRLKLEMFATETLSKFDVIAQEELEKDGKLDPDAHLKNNWASELSHPCARALTYARLNFADRRDKGSDSGFIYRVLAGKKFERELRSEFAKADVEIILNQKRFTWEKFEISGRVDGMIVRARKEIPLEVKFINPRFFDQISDIASIKNHRSYWISRLLTQLNLYQLMANSEFGFLAIGSPGKRPKILVNQLDLEIGEEAIKKAELVNAHVKKKTYPDQIPYSDLCEICDYNAICSPIKFQTQEVLDDDELRELVSEWKLHKDSAKKFDKIEKKLKAVMRGRDAIIDDVEITTTEYLMTKTKLPDDVKAQYSFKEKVSRVDIKVIGE